VQSSVLDGNMHAPNDKAIAMVQIPEILCALHFCSIPVKKISIHSHTHTLDYTRLKQPNFIAWRPGKSRTSFHPL